MILVDSREKRPEIQALGERRFLSYENPLDPAHPWSYDLEIHTAAGQVICLEVKQASDLLSSFEKLPRQLGPVDGLIVEGFNRRALHLSERAEDPKFVALIENLRKRLWRLSFSKAILYTDDMEDTVGLLRYLESRREPIEIFNEAPTP